MRRVAIWPTTPLCRSRKILATALLDLPSKRPIGVVGAVSSGSRPRRRCRNSSQTQDAAPQSRIDIAGFRDAPAVITFIFLNVVAFVFEIFYGNWTDPALYRVGAFEPYSVIALGQYWRLVTALFLHAGPVHLIFNLFALYVLGPPLERSIGSLRFCVCYLIAGIGSTTGVLGLVLLNLIRPALLVGASGSIMGIVGAWAAFLLLHRHAPRARQRLSNVVMIIVIQIAFDLSTPQVSMAAHMCGLITGFLVGLALAPRKSSI